LIIGNNTKLEVISFENIMLSERSLSENHKYCMIPLIYTNQIYRDRKQNGSLQRQRGTWSFSVHFQFWKMKKVLEMVIGDNCTIG
jgi:hypothetical protein